MKTRSPDQEVLHSKVTPLTTEVEIGLLERESLTGDPAMSVPFGTGADGLPVGVQIIAPSLGESVMLQVAAELERQAPNEGDLS